MDRPMLPISAACHAKTAAYPYQPALGLNSNASMRAAHLHQDQAGFEFSFGRALNKIINFPLDF
jgi:hypothetical protein